MTDGDFYSALLDRCGYVEEDRPSAEGSMQNDLAAERADVVVKFIGLARYASLPAKLLPVAEPHNGDSCENVERENDDMRGDVNAVLWLLGRRGFVVDSTTSLLRNVRPALRRSPDTTDTSEESN